MMPPGANPPITIIIRQRKRRITVRSMGKQREIRLGPRLFAIARLLLAQTDDVLPLPALLDACGLLDSREDRKLLMEYLRQLNRRSRSTLAFAAIKTGYRLLGFAVYAPTPTMAIPIRASMVREEA